MYTARQYCPIGVERRLNGLSNEVAHGEASLSRHSREPVALFVVDTDCQYPFRHGLPRTQLGPVAHATLIPLGLSKPIRQNHQPVAETRHQLFAKQLGTADRKSTRLNSSH